jgi:hypothetical protein
MLDDHEDAPDPARPIRGFFVSSRVSQPIAFAILGEILGEKSIVLRIVPRPTTPAREYAFSVPFVPQSML